MHDHPRPGKIQGAVAVKEFLRDFREILARLSHERKVDLVLQRYAARADASVAPATSRRIVALLILSGSRAGIGAIFA